jgi:[ribosomal protein S5]-alanine N-acetyltransferase
VAIVVLRPCLTARTTRLVIRPLAAHDHDAWRAANEQHPPPDSPFDPGPRPAVELTRKTFRGIVVRNRRLARQDLFYQLALLDQAEKTMFGMVSLQVVARVIVQLAWIGWRVFGQHRRKGYGREGVEATLGIAFRELRLHRVEAGIEPGNRVSARLARSVRMHLENTEKNSAFIGGAWKNLDVWVASAEDHGITAVPTFGVGVGDVRRVEVQPGGARVPG